MTRTSKLDLYREEIARSLADGVSINSLATQLKVSRSGLQGYVKRNNLRAETLPTSRVSKLALMDAEVRDLRSRVRKEQKTDVESERVLEEIRSAFDAPEPKYQPREAKEDGVKGHVQALLLSDLHAGEIVRSEAVNRMNEFNWDILVKRMENIHRSLLSFQLNRPYPVDELQVWMLGDMCSGSNHDELKETNEFTAAEQGYRTGILLGKFIEELVPYYPSIKVRGVVGNHPRLSKPPANKNVFNSFDWLAYKLAEQRLENYESVDCQFPQAGMQVAQIAGLKWLLFHGDGIRSSMPGVPWGGVLRRWTALKKQFAEGGVYLDGAALGHFHQAAAVAGILMNGSVKGPDEYSLKNFGSGEQPTQLLATFNPAKSRCTDVSYINP